MAAPDPLFKIRNNFYLGDYLSAIHYSSIRNLSQEESVQRDTLVYRSYIARGDCLTVITEIDDASAPTPLQAVKLLALHFSHQLKNKVPFPFPSTKIKIPKFGLAVGLFLNCCFVAGSCEIEIEGVAGRSCNCERPDVSIDCWYCVHF